MATPRTCKECGNSIPSGELLCPHCARPSLYPNVEAAEAPEERSALDRRYNAAVQQAKDRGCEVPVRQFEDVVRGSKAVIARRSPELLRLATSDNEVYATYYQLARAGVRIPNDDKWGQLRGAADEVLFLNYREEIRFAALSLDNRGLSNYGNCTIVLQEDMIAHRATVFEENSTMFVKRHHEHTDEPYRLPRGHRATWDDRHRLCTAKKAGELWPDTQPDEFPAMLLKQGATSQDDDFVEVHVCGPMTRRTFERVVIRPSANATRAEKALLSAVEFTLDEAGVPVEVAS